MDDFMEGNMRGERSPKFHVTKKIFVSCYKGERVCFCGVRPFRSNESTDGTADFRVVGGSWVTSTDLDFVCRAATRVYEPSPARQRR